MNKRRSQTGRAGFTLMEILLVVVIIGVASAVAIPTFARSFRGAKVRNSTRTVMMMHRHAQTKAVLGQRYMALLFDEVKGTLEMVDQGQPGVKIRSFRGGKEIDGIHFVSYYPNGMCEAYSVEIGDDENRTAKIKVDAVTGKAKVERE